MSEKDPEYISEKDAITLITMIENVTRRQAKAILWAAVKSGEISAIYHAPTSESIN